MEPSNASFALTNFLVTFDTHLSNLSASSKQTQTRDKNVNDTHLHLPRLPRHYLPTFTPPPYQFLRRIP